MRKEIGLGIDSFRKLIESDVYYVDKTSFVKEIIDTKSEVLLFTRPRRFGKTLNMDMLKNYFENNEKDQYHLFKGLEIEKQGQKYKDHFGKYPVIFLTFKSVAGLGYEEASFQMKEEIAKEYERHSYLLDSDLLSDAKKKKYETIREGEGQLTLYGSSILNLCKYLYQYHNEKAIILIDEYDTPLHYAKLWDYYDQMVSFMRTLMVNAMKGNEFLQKAVITGITKISQESIFSAFNNPKVSTILDSYCDDQFGFTEEEVKEILRYYDLECKYTEVKEWYNGYLFGENKVIYNPWSILSYIEDDRNTLGVYWVNTGNTSLIKKSIKLNETRNKEIIQKLMKNEEVEVTIDMNIIYEDMFHDSDKCWSLLLQSGYLKGRKGSELNKYFIEIPNKEVRQIYKEIIISWFKDEINVGTTAKNALDALSEKDFLNFEKNMNNIILNNTSYYDSSFRKKEEEGIWSTELMKDDTKYENFHHGIILGMLVYLEKDYIIESNKEYGLGRPDIVVIPKDKEKEGFIIEFKRCKKDEKITLEELADKALQQIEEMKYEDGLQQYGVKAFIKLGIGYKGKECRVKEREF